MERHFQSHRPVTQLLPLPPCSTGSTATVPTSNGNHSSSRYNNNNSKKHHSMKKLSHWIHRLTIFLSLLLSLVVVSNFYIGVTLHSTTTTTSSSSSTTTTQKIDSKQQNHDIPPHLNNDHMDAVSVSIAMQDSHKNAILETQKNTTTTTSQSTTSNSISIYYNNLKKLRTDNLWTNNINLPQWMKDFMDWQVQQLLNLTIDNWGEYRYLVLRCYRADERCGGVSDRLKPIPLMTLAAARSSRILLIHWDRPFALEEFLVSPPGGFPWHVPDFLQDIMLKRPKQLLTRAKSLVHYANQSTATLAHTHIHDTHGGSIQYNEEFALPGETAENCTDYFGMVYHDLFRIFFQPAPAIQTIIQQKLTSKGLIPGQYAVAHYRAEYGREVKRHPILTQRGFMRNVAENAIRCASDILPNKPIYFASDNPTAMDVVKSYAMEHGNYPIIMFERSEALVLSLDYYGNETHTTKPSDYYSTFVDLYVAGNGQCVAYGRGGFGRFASLLSFNSTCSKKHTKNFFPEHCHGYENIDNGNGNTTFRWRQNPTEEQQEQDKLIQHEIYEKQARGQQ